MREATSSGPPAKTIPFSKVRLSTDRSTHRATNLRGANLEHPEFVGEVGSLGFAIVFTDEPVHRNRDIGWLSDMASRRPGLTIGPPVLRPVPWRAAKDPEEHRHSEFGGAYHRLWAATGAEPDAQWLFRPRADEHVVQRATSVRTAPRDPLVAGALISALSSRGVSRSLASFLYYPSRRQQPAALSAVIDALRPENRRK